MASTDGVNIDQHFGRAEQFYVYEIGEGGVTQEERRCLPSDVAGQDRLQAAVQLLSDVSYVLCAQIGPHAVEALAASGMTGYALPGNVQKTLQNYIRRQGLLKNLALCGNLATTACRPGGCAGCRG
jgi:nitrogen fixation protein NifB